jgi:hypothetical protein
MKFLGDEDGGAAGAAARSGLYFDNRFTSSSSLTPEELDLQFFELMICELLAFLTNPLPSISEFSNVCTPDSASARRQCCSGRFV